MTELRYALYQRLGLEEPTRVARFADYKVAREAALRRVRLRAATREEQPMYAAVRLVNDDGRELTLFEAQRFEQVNYKTGKTEISVRITKENAP